MLECARPILPDDSLDDIGYTNHGVIAIIAPTNKMQTGFDQSTFEHLCVRINSCSVNCIAHVIYRPGSEHVNQQFFKELPNQQFFKELSKLLAYLATLSAPIFITADFNIRLDRLDDPFTIQLNKLLASLELSQHVDHPTHDLGGILDVVLTRSDQPAPRVSIIDVGLSDHRYVKFTLDLCRPPLVYDTFTKRSWRGFDVKEFRMALLKSPICVAAFIIAQTDAEGMTQTYNLTITNILDRPVPLSQVTHRKRRSDVWYDEDCRQQQRLTRRLEWRYRSSDRKEDRVTWLASLKKLHKLFGSKKAKFWTSKITEQRNDPHKL